MNFGALGGVNIQARESNRLGEFTQLACNHANIKSFYNSTKKQSKQYTYQVNQLPERAAYSRLIL